MFSAIIANMVESVHSTGYSFKSDPHFAGPIPLQMNVLSYIYRASPHPLLSPG